MKRSWPIIWFLVVLTPTVFLAQQLPSEPEVKLAPLSPVVRGTISLTASVSEPLLAQVEKVVFLKNSQVLADGQRQENQWCYTWDTSQETDGVYLIVARAIAGQAEYNSQEISTLVDTTSPQGEISIPPREYFNQAFVAKVKASDNVSGVDTISATIGEEKISGNFSGNDEYSIGIDILKSGSYILAVTISDKAGNAVQLSPLTIAIDRTPPTIQTGSLFPLIWSDRGKLLLELRDDFSQVASLQIQSTKIIYEIANPKTEELVDLDCSQLPEGSHFFTIILQDRAGNVEQQKLGPFVIDRTPPQVVATQIPASISVGVVSIKLQWQDNLSGIDELNSTIILNLQDKTYAFRICSRDDKVCEAQLSITEGFPQGTGQIYLAGLKDRAGNSIEKIHLGEIKIETSSINGTWPLEPRNKGHKLLRVYSRHSTPDKSPVWISAQSGMEVKSVADGEIVEILASNKDRRGYLRIQQLHGDWAWGYHHIVVGKNPATNSMWTVGDMVQSGDILGTVAYMDKDSQSYLYLELVHWQDGTWMIAACPLDFLLPKFQEYIAPQVLLNAKNMVKGSTADLEFVIPWTSHRVAGKYGLTNMLLIGYTALVAMVLAIILFSSRRFDFRSRVESLSSEKKENRNG